MEINTLLSVRNRCLIIAYNKGYNIDKHGNSFFKNKAIKPLKNKNGYLNFSVRIIIDGKSFSKNISVHRLQAYQKYGNNIFNEGIKVRHRDGNKENNSYENILIGTQSENILDIPVDVRIKNAIYASSFIKKYNHEEILRMHKEGISYSNIMIELGIKSRGTISFVINKSILSKEKMGI